MYAFLLAFHSLIRWLVLASLLLAIYRGWRGWLGKHYYTLFDNRVRIVAAMFAHIQLVVGLALYGVSSIVYYFWQHPVDALQIRGIRFFGIEHITMMLVAIVLITIGSIKARRKTDDLAKFRIMAIWFSIALLIILSSVPWSFSPLISRPNFRPFF
jgi:hypothetical protein